MKKDAILSVDELKVRFYTYEGIVKAIEGVNLFVRKGETLGVAGETGCGKSVTGLSILNLVPSPGKIEDGKIIFSKDGKQIDLLQQDEQYLCALRGKDISMVFQEPRAALNPVYTVERQIGEVLILHRKEEIVGRVIKQLRKDLEKENNPIKRFIYKTELGLYKKMMKNSRSLYLKAASKIPIIRRYEHRLWKEIRKEVIKILKEMEIADPERVVDAYPHELSGGMAQRVVIAMALACNPVLLIADEPTTSLDVTVQAQVLDLIRRLKEKFGSSIIYVTHDLGVIAELCERVAIMYAGSICEVADVYELFKNPLHPYTRGLLEAIPHPDKPFKSIKGFVPNLIDPPSGCRFHPRCPYAMDICKQIKPKIREIKKDHFVACHLFGES